VLVVRKVSLAFDQLELHGCALGCSEASPIFEGVKGKFNVWRAERQRFIVPPCTCRAMMGKRKLFLEEDLWAKVSRLVATWPDYLSASRFPQMCKTEGGGHCGPCGWLLHFSPSATRMVTMCAHKHAQGTRVFTDRQAVHGARRLHH
jgi:hypothetical protein